MYTTIKIFKYEIDKLSLESALNLIENDPLVQKHLKNHKILESKLLVKEVCDPEILILTKKCAEIVTA